MFCFPPVELANRPFQTENGECCAFTLQVQHLSQVYQKNMSMDRLAKAGSERLKAGNGGDGRFALEVAFVFAMCVCVTCMFFCFHGAPFA